MATTTRDNSETSVTFSLAELAQIEEQRVREEDHRKAKQREQTARAAAEAAEKRRAEELLHIAAQEEARAKRARAEAEEAARAKAREQASIEVARIQAESKARLDAENAARAHDLAMLKVKTESGAGKLKVALGIAIGLAVLGGSATAIGVTRHTGALSHEVAELRDQQAALAKERDQAKQTQLAALDRRFEALRDRKIAKANPDKIAEGVATAEAARKAIDEKALDHNRLRAFDDALDALDGRLDALDRLRVLDERRQDIDAWAAQKKKGDVSDQTRAAAARARVIVDESALAAYEKALDQARDALGKAPMGSVGGAGTTGSQEGPCIPCSGDSDPLCKPNGCRL